MKEHYFMKTDATWKTQTIDTINRLRGIRARNPNIPFATWSWAMSQARLLTDAMHVESTKYWNVYINCIRILIGFVAEVAPDADELFNDDAVDLPLLKKTTTSKTK
jgi:hypothetical protein